MVWFIQGSEGGQTTGENTHLKVNRKRKVRLGELRGTGHDYHQMQAYLLTKTTSKASSTYI